MDACFRFVPMPLFNSLSETVMGYLAPLVGSIDSTAVVPAMIKRQNGILEQNRKCVDKLQNQRQLLRVGLGASTVQQ